MIYTVTPDTPAVLGAEGADEIVQDIALIIRTRQGDCPGFRRFGLPKEYVGMPVQAAISVFRNELRDALQDFSVPANIISVRGEIGPDGELYPVVEVEIT
jgi:hypothetical protein